MPAERSAEVNRLQKTLEGANIKLASVASDPLGLSGREMLNALIDGSTDVASMAELARGKLRAKRGLLERALAGRGEGNHRFLLQGALCYLDMLAQGMRRVGGGMNSKHGPFSMV